MGYRFRITKEEAQLYSFEYPNQVRSPRPDVVLDRGTLTDAELLSVIALLCTEREREKK